MREYQRSSLVQVQSLYWVMRKVVRGYRAAVGKFGPRRRFKGARRTRRFRRPGGKPGKGKRNKGLYLGQTFVNLEEIPIFELRLGRFEIENYAD